MRQAYPFLRPEASNRTCFCAGLKKLQPRCHSVPVSAAYPFLRTTPGTWAPRSVPISACSLPPFSELPVPVSAQIQGITVAELPPSFHYTCWIGKKLALTLNVYVTNSPRLSRTCFCVDTPWPPRLDLAAIHLAGCRRTRFCVALRCAPMPAGVPISA